MCPAFVTEVTDAAANTPVIPSHAAVYLRGRCPGAGDIREM
ncbi:MAG: hypothetical protein WBX20_20145 [Terrimicrobiaceae bacterium]